MPARAWRLLPAAAIFVGLLAAAPSASATNSPLNWKPCGDAPNVQCATLRAPLDYDHPNGDQVKLFIARSPATGHRIGSLFYNPGGPGGTVADYFEEVGADGFPGAQRALRHRRHRPARRRPEHAVDRLQGQPGDQGIYSEPFTTPFNLDVGALIAKDQRYIKRCLDRNDGILPHVSTANVARDMDALRRLLGERKLNYFGYSYGTFLGATYASLFPNNYRAMVLDGPLDADGYINNPRRDLREQSAGFERALGRFFQACAARPGRLPRLRRRRSVAPRRAGRRAPTRRRSRPTATRRPAAGRRRRHPRAATFALYTKGCGRCSGQALAIGAGRRRHAHALRWSDGRLRPQRRRHVRPGHRPLLHDRRDRAEVPA